jgi:hypothetical protein
VPGHGRLTGVFAPVRASRGETVGLRLDPAHCHVFAAAREPFAPATDEADEGGPRTAGEAAAALAPIQPDPTPP